LTSDLSSYQPLDADLTTLATDFTTASASGPTTLAFKEDTDNGSNKVTLSAPSSIASDYTFTLPNSGGTVDYVLRTDGSGGTSWVAQSGGGNSFATIAVSGQSDVVADSSTDTLTLVAGSNITLTTNATTDTITIAATGGGTLGDGDYGDITVSGSGTVLSIDAGVVGATELAATIDAAATNFTFQDNNFRIKDNADTSKVVDFQCSGITTATTRTLTIPNASGTIALISDLSAYQGLDSTLTALASYNTNGLLTQTSADTFVGRTLTGTTNEITVTNGDGVSGDPTISLPSTLALRSKAVQVQDNNFTIADNGDVTKLLAFECSGITTGTTRTLTVQNVSGTVLVTGGSDVVVADGGTGASSFTAYAVVCGGTTPTGAFQSVASLGSAGDVLTSNGAGALPTFQAPAGGGSGLTHPQVMARVFIGC
jgi:hypothetical protein